MKTISLIVMVAIVLEAIVEYAKTVADMIEEREYKTAVTQAVTIVLGIGLAFIFHLQLFNNGMSEFYSDLSINPVFDMILTGILFSRGSNYVSDLIGRLKPEKSTIVSQLQNTLAELENEYGDEPNLYEIEDADEEYELEPITLEEDEDEEGDE